MTSPDVAEARKRRAAKRYLQRRRAVSRIDFTDLPTGVLVLLCKLTCRGHLPLDDEQRRLEDCQPKGTYCLNLGPMGCYERPHYGTRRRRTPFGLMVQVLVPIIDNQLQWINVRRAS